jgi:ribose transport system ATP-binding protein
VAERVPRELGRRRLTAGPDMNGDAAAAASPPVLLEARRFAKTFASTTVLHDVDVDLRGGEVRALLGQNGSGKSTFIKLLTGFHEPDPGATLRVRGTEVAMPVHWQDVSRLGLCVMHQDLGLEQTLSVTDNFMLGGTEWRSSLRRISWRRQHREVRRSLERFGLDLDPSQPVTQLSGPERAVVALVRALHQLGDEAGILVLDEPTASLEREAVEALFGAVRAARDRGCGVLFVSHNLDEVLRLCDTVTILRDGRLVEEGPVTAFTHDSLVSAIVGREIGELYPPAPPHRDLPVALQADDLRGETIGGVDLRLHEGEILGVTGLAGMGQDELPMLLYGASPCAGGRVRVFGEEHRPDPRASLDAGMALVPADRKRLGGDMAATLEQNLSLPVLERYWRRGAIDRASERQDVLSLLRSFDVRPADPLRKLGELSGGNQQKLLLGKWIELFGEARILLLHEPTQGVDVGARQEIFRFIRAAADRGVAVLYVSTEHEDLAHLCDRVLVLRGGRVRAELERPLDAAQLSALSLTPAAEVA